MANHRRFERPASRWVRRDIPELCIISDDLWEQVQSRFRAARALYTRRPNAAFVATRTRAAKRRHVLSGFPEFEACGVRFGCTAPTSSRGFRSPRPEPWGSRKTGSGGAAGRYIRCDGQFRGVSHLPRRSRRKMSRSTKTSTFST